MPVPGDIGPSLMPTHAAEQMVALMMSDSR